MNNRGDGFTLTFFVLFFGVGLLFVSSSDIDRLFHLWLLLPPLLLLAAGIAILIFCHYSVKYIVTRRWRRLASILLAPPLAAVSIVSMVHIGITPEWLHLHLDREDYLAQAARLPNASTGTAFQIWDWGGTGGVATINQIYSLVYDESDEIALEPAQRSSSWQQRMDKWRTGTAMYSILDQSDSPHEVEVTRLERFMF